MKLRVCWYGSINHLTATLGTLVLFTATAWAQPANDDCANATVIVPNPNITCNKIPATVEFATSSGTPAAPCGGASGYDVWFRFDAVSANTNIQISDFGANFTNRRLQLLSGSCGSLTAISCVTGNTINATGLTVGATYYIRVFSSSGTAPTTNGGFNICVYSTPGAQRFGNSYVNITKQNTGGVVEPGDILEIRMTINHTAGTIYQMRYLDSVPTHTQMLSGPTDYIQVITNEGLPYYSFTATPNVNDDAATYLSSPPAGEYHVRINLGFGTFPGGAPANNSVADLTGATGRAIANGAGNHRPRGGGGMLFATAFRVQVTGSPGDTIRLGAGKFIYRTVAAGGTDIELTGTPYKILISEPASLCSNATGVNNAEEFGGSFGGGNTLNRSTDLSFPIPNYTFVASSSFQGVGDGQYAIVNNISPRSGTIRTAERTPNCPTPLPSELSCNYRMFNGHWDIDGDHTGTNNIVGNIPPGPSDSSGYMLMVNADYVASETYRQTITNLCPNTYYEFSAWLRNICPTCGIDSTGAAYSPRQPGVLPNLTFSLDGIDRYNTGGIDTGGWVKKGFLFRTGPSQTSATFAIRNNAQGGGGNDWAMDDISIATCLPNMSYSPSLNPNVCEGNSLTINDTVRSFFGNYTHYIWQRSTDNGVTWSDVGSPGNASPIINGNGEYEYITSYTIPHTATNVSDSGDRYRVIVATTSDNLSSASCQVTDGVSIISLSVMDCGVVLSTELLSFHAKLLNGYAQLNWSSGGEEEGVYYIIEKSVDGMNFQAIGTVNRLQNGATVNYYSFADPELLRAKAWYRVVINAADRQRKHSQVLQLKPGLPSFEILHVVNPFRDNLRFDVSLTESSALTIELFDNSGRRVREEKQIAYAGVNSMSLSQTGNLAPGVYTLRIRDEKGRMLSWRVLNR